MKNTYANKPNTLQGFTSLYPYTKPSIKYSSKQQAFTIVELLIVIVVIAILAAISIAAYNGIQQRARAVSLQSNITQIHKLIELYYAEHGEYPKTTASALVSGPSGTSPWTDSNCAVGNARSDWVPGIGVIP